MTSDRPDLYGVLGVAPSATPAEIRHAYRWLLRQHHPDTRVPVDEPQRAGSDDSAQALQHLVAAYAVLRDPALRAAYDRETRARETAPARRPRRAPNLYASYEQRWIVAGPVQWHRAPNPPQAL